MKQIFMIIVMGVLLLGGCQREVILKVDQAPQKIVVQANLASDGHTINVALNRTTSLYGSVYNTHINGAKVSLHDIANKETITLQDTGMDYSSLGEPSYPAAPNTTYMLMIQIGDTVLQSVCFMPQPIAHDSLSIDKYVNKNDLTDTTYVVTLRFTDIANQQNYYKILTTVNGKILPNIAIINDNYRDGQQIKTSIKDDLLTKGANVRIELQHITPQIYQYYYTLRQSMSGMSDSPANPPTNISGGAIGYFSAYGVDVIDLRIY